MYTWTKDLETGNKTVDEQHRKIIDAINELMGALMQLKGIEKAKETIDFLSNYVVFHFNEEEQLQKNSGYPDFARHKQLHEDFKRTAQGLVADYKREPENVQVISKLLKVVGDWLVTHIKKEDVAMAKYITSK